MGKGCFRQLPPNLISSFQFTRCGKGSEMLATAKGLGSCLDGAPRPQGVTPGTSCPAHQAAPAQETSTCTPTRKHSAFSAQVLGERKGDSLPPTLARASGGDCGAAVVES